MASNYTENYGLCQWEAMDQVLRTDFNEDNAKVDAALADNASAIKAEIEARVSAINNLSQTHNCSLTTMSYTGNGSTSRVFNFTSCPMVVHIMGMEHWVCAIQGSAIGSGRYLSGGGGQRLNISWSGNSVTISSPNSDASYMCNWSGERYCLVALLQV